MPNKDIITILTSQIPLIIMTLNNGVSIFSLIPILLVPIIIYFIEVIPVCFRYLWREKIPRSYVYYYIGDKSKNASHNINFIEDLSVFLNEFYPESIKNGNVKNYFRLEPDPTIIMRCYRAIISPDINYFCKFSFAQKKNGIDILDKIKQTGFKLPIDMNLKKLLFYPIYLSIENIREEVVSDNRDGKKVEQVTKQYVKIAGIDMETVDNFIYIVVNYHIHKKNNINNFRLQKYIYYYDEKHNYDDICSYVNVNKNYKNVFLSRTNTQMVINNIHEWEKNKNQQIEKGIPNKMGFLFYGEPGCGKSSLIYAIANETKKHIVSINMQDMTNKAFMVTAASIDNKIVVIDDVDTYEFTHKRSDIIKEKADVTATALQLALLSSTDKDSISNRFYKKMTLDVLLDVLDGYSYLNNCIVILTTNHPEILDPALIRPGRVDHQIKFTLTDEYQFNKMFKYFTGSIYKKISPNFIFKENTYTSSYLINTIILPNKNHPQKILELLL